PTTSMPQTFRSDKPLSRIELACYFAAVAAVSVLLLLPFVPADYFYRRAALYLYDGRRLPGIHWRVGLLIAFVAVSAFASAYVWARRAGRVYFSAWRGLFCALLSFVYATVFVTLLGHWLSDETLPFIRL